MKQFLIFLFVILIGFGCGSSSNQDGDSSQPLPKSMVEDEAEYDPRGIGEIKHVELNSPLHQAMIERGKAIYDMKCAACHKLNDQRVVGPGWKGITERRTPEWIMNMTTNVEMMLEKDPQAREMLKECLVRMPNQNLSIGDARDVLEFIYHNDQE